MSARACEWHRMGEDKGSRKLSLVSVHRQRHMRRGDGRSEKTSDLSRPDDRVEKEADENCIRPRLVGDGQDG